MGMAGGNRRGIEMNYSQHWHFLRPTARGILEREITPGRSLPDVPFVARRVDQVARVLYELSQALEVPAGPRVQNDDPIETFYETFLPHSLGARPCPDPDNRWAQELWAELAAQQSTVRTAEDEL